ncbi:hypothetical protein B1A_20920, partial [mine drainage metagenome]
MALPTFRAQKRNWLSEWKTYWNNTLTEQSANLYVIGEATLSTVTGGAFGNPSGFLGLGKAFAGGGTFSFVPTALTADYANDVFLEGKTPGGNHLVLGYVLANGTSNETELSHYKQMVSNEFAVSPGGQYLYLANLSE